MENIFKLKTSEGHTMKILADLLQNNIKNGCFIINQKGVFLRTTDSNNCVLLDVNLSSDKFTIYNFNSPTQLNVGLNLTHYHKMLKNVKKDESIELWIDNEAEKRRNFNILISTKGETKKTHSVITIQNIQNISINNIPENYEKSILIPSKEFQKMIKNLSTISNIIEIITMNNQIIRFNSNAGGVMQKSVEFGETDSPKQNITFKEDFDVNQLVKISKLSTLNPNGFIQIYANTNKPLLLKTNIGNIGNISIYIKSKKQLEHESKTKEEDEDE